jgi:putative ABC transport system substrate-binding protein
MKQSVAPGMAVRLAIIALMAVHASSAFAAGKIWKVAIVQDTQQDFALRTREGFVAALDGLLAKRGDKAAYSLFDTELSADKAASIVASLKSLGPDLAFTINYPTAFADLSVASKLKDQGLKFVSENPVPVQSGVAESWERPGGNETGVSIFVRFNVEIKLMRLIRPEAKRLVMFSWDAMKLVNDWYGAEVRRACKEEGVELVAFGLVPSIEAEEAFLLPYADKGSDYFLSGVISAWVHDDGSPADLNTLEAGFMLENMHIPMVCYDEDTLKIYAPAGACVIWGDLGAQAAEKGLRLIDGADPGSIPWDYPRKYNIILNMAAAKRLGIVFPQSLVNAAYRVYTDFDGHYVGQGE